MNPWTDSPDFAREAAKVESAGEALMLTLLWWRRAGWTVVTQKPIEQYRIEVPTPGSSSGDLSVPSQLQQGGLSA